MAGPSARLFGVYNGIFHRFLNGNYSGYSLVFNYASVSFKRGIIGLAFNESCQGFEVGGSYESSGLLYGGDQFFGLGVTQYYTCVGDLVCF